MKELLEDECSGSPETLRNYEKVWPKFVLL